MLFGTIGGILIGLVYLASILNLCRLIYKCAYTEPGVIPAVPSARSDILRAQSTKDGLHVEYKREVERTYHGDKQDYFW